MKIAYNKEQGFVDAWELDVDAKSLQSDYDKKKAFRWIVSQTRSGVYQPTRSCFHDTCISVGHPTKSSRIGFMRFGSKTRQALERLCANVAIKKDDRESWLQMMLTSNDPSLYPIGATSWDFTLKGCV